jgi:ribosomal-protein-alanine N-acetyltransferase
LRLTTPHLELHAYSPEHLLALIDGNERFQESFGFPVADGLRSFLVSDDVSPEWIARVRQSSTADPWIHGFAVVDLESQTVVGTTGFKGPPDDEGVVEIGYGIVPSHEGRGLATEAAAALVTFAFAEPEVRCVRAHTLPAKNASTRVLEKCGFEFRGEVVDPDDGPVWRWERQRS